MKLTDRLASTVLASDIDLDRRSVERFLRQVAIEEAPLATGEELAAAADEVVGLGPVERLLRDESITDVLVNSPGEVWIERAGALERSDVTFDSGEAVLAAIERAITPLGLRIDRSSPLVDARLPDGSRLHAAIPPASPDGPVIAVRRFTEAVADLDQLKAGGSISRDHAGLLRQAVEDRRNIIVSGGTGTGKTTLLNVLSRLVSTGQRMVVVEDASELKLDGHVVRLEAHPANAEGAGGVSLRQLMRAALRLRPDRIVLGEVRGSEAVELLTALNSGHDGSMSTVHASGPRQAVRRLQTLAMAGDANLPERAIERQLEDGIDIVVQLERTADGRRRVVDVMEGPW